MNIVDCQHTLAEEVVFEGAGIHLGLPVTLRLKPAPAGAGITFRRTDMAGTPAIPARMWRSPSRVRADRQTSLELNGTSVNTIEHLMAALHALGVDNAEVEVSGPELPAMDGSACQYAEAIARAGLAAQEAERTYFRVPQPVFWQERDAMFAVFPDEEFRVSYTLSYGSQALPDQFASFSVTPEVFKTQIAPARTFCLKEEAEALRAQGFGKGASLENTLVFDGHAPLGNTLRFDNEAARHKILDLIGDLYLLGRPFRGHVIAAKTGHRQNAELVSRLLSEGAGSTAQKGRESVARPVQKELGIEDIRKILPHRYPFLLVDRVLELEPGKRGVGIKNVTANEPFFRGHFPEEPVMPGVLIIEAMAQAGGVVILSVPGNAGKMAYLLSIDYAKFRRKVVPGDTLRMEIEVLRVRASTGQCRGVAKVDGHVVCEAEVKFFLGRGEEPEPAQ